MKFLAIILVLWPPALLAQFTLVSGTVKDPSGLPYSNGTITPILVISGSPRFTATGFPYTPPTQPSGLDNNGTFAMQLADVNALTPAGGTWSFHVCSAAGTVQPGSPITQGPVCFDVAGLVVTGNMMDISAQLDAAAKPLTNLPNPFPSITDNGTNVSIGVPTIVPQLTFNRSTICATVPGQFGPTLSFGLNTYTGFYASPGPPTTIFTCLGNVPPNSGTIGDINGHVSFTFGGRVNVKQLTGGLFWSNTDSFASNVSDTGLTRPSAGVIAVGNGTVGDTSGVLRAASFQGSGTVVSNCGTATPPFTFAGTTNTGLMLGGSVANAIGFCVGYVNPLVTMSQFAVTLLNTAPLVWSSNSTSGSGSIPSASLSIQGVGIVQAGQGTPASNGGFVGNLGHGVVLTANAAIPNVQPVKVDPSNPIGINGILPTTTTDTGPGIVIGVNMAVCAASSPCPISTTGVSRMSVDGTCVGGNFVQVSPTTNGRVICTSTFNPGQVIGKALNPDSGSLVYVMVGLR